MAHSVQTLLFPAVAGREVVAALDGGDITSDCGALLLARADEKVGLVDAMADHIFDQRQPTKVRHSLHTLLR
jgi:hypothetical protein